MPSSGYLHSLGGDVVVDAKITTLDQLPSAKAVLCDLSPKPLLRIAGHRFPRRYRHQLDQYRYGLGVFKVDWALASPIPWKAAECRRAGTLHLGGSLKEIAASEKVHVGRTDCRSSIRPPEPANAVRSLARARRQACGVGLLPCAGGIRP